MSGRSSKIRKTMIFKMGREGHLRLEAGARNLLGMCTGDSHKSRAGMRVGEAVQARDWDERGSCPEKPPNLRKLKRAPGQNRACRWWKLLLVQSLLSACFFPLSLFPQEREITLLLEGAEP